MRMKKTSIVGKMFSYKIGLITVTLLFFIILYYNLPQISRNVISIHNLLEKNNSSIRDIKYKSEYFENIAAIVEFRSTPVLVTIVLNVIQNIPSHWPVQIFHSESNVQFIRESRLSTYIQNEKILLTKLNDCGNDFSKYTNALFTNISFWKQVRGEKILFFQIDSVMCSNSPHKITDYLQYDYIGAPWDSREPRVGNGGFSFRNKNKTLNLLEQMNYSGDVNEDVWYSMHMLNVGSVIAPLNVSKTFSVESIFYENPLGVHKMGINKTDLKKLCEACPDARLVPPYCI